MTITDDCEEQGWRTGCMYPGTSRAAAADFTFFFLMAWSYAPCKARFFSLTVMFSLPSSSRSNTCTGVDHCSGTPTAWARNPQISSRQSSLTKCAGLRRRAHLFELLFQSVWVALHLMGISEKLPLFLVSRDLLCSLQDSTYVVCFSTLAMTHSSAMSTRINLRLGWGCSTCSFRYASAGLISLDPFFFTIVFQLFWPMGISIKTPELKENATHVSLEPLTGDAIRRVNSRVSL